MLCRIISKFDNTESAQSAARLIQNNISGISSIRLQDHGNIPDTIYIDTITYTSNGIMLNPVVPFFEYDSIKHATGTENLVESGKSEECCLEIYADQEIEHRVRQMILNYGGYDTSIQY